MTYNRGRIGGIFYETGVGEMGGFALPLLRRRFA